MKKRLRSWSCSLFGLLLCPALLSTATTAAGQNITVNTSVTHDVYGNGDATDNGRWTSGNINDLLPPTGNIVNINSGGTVTGLVYGGYALTALGSGSPTASNNQVFLNDGASVSGTVYGGEASFFNSDLTSGTATVELNTVTISGGSVGLSVVGGVAWVSSGLGNAKAASNTVNAHSNDAVFYVTGGEARSASGGATATANKVFIYSGAVSNDVRGGYATSSAGNVATANNNEVTISGGSAGHYDAVNNVYTSVYGGAAKVYSGSGTATAELNKVTISGGLVDSNVYSGYAESSSGAATAEFNTVTISGGSTNWSVYGGYAESSSGAATANNNKADISGTAYVDNSIYGGYAWVSSGSGTATATNNTVTISGTAFVNGSVYGGYAESSSGAAKATNNTVNISGGTVIGDIFGGFAYSSSQATASTGSGATNNTVTISGTPVFDADTNLYGGATATSNGVFIPGADIWTGNTLNLYSSNLTVAGLHNFQYLNFYVPTDAVNGDTMLHVTGTANIANSTVNVGIDGASSPLKAGDKINLIEAGTLTGTPANTASKGEGMQGVTLQYEFNITTEGNQLWATVTSVEASDLVKSDESLSQGFLSGMGLLNQGSDLIAGLGMAAAVDAANRPNIGSYGLGLFGVAAAGSSRYATGSSVDVSGISLMAGIAKRIDTQPGKLMVGAFFEYGNGSYDTYSSFHGDGDLDHFGGGIIGRFDLAGSKTGHFYTEGSARIGTIDNDFGNLYYLGQEVRYDSSSTYYGIHLGSGYIWNLTDKASLDFYARYFWTQQKGDTVRLTTGDPVDFDNVNSHRMRIGTRFAYAANASLSPYVGMAYEHEFDGEARATTNGHAFKAPSIDGGTGVGELGLTFKPSAAVPISLDLGAQGYVGTREGVTGTLHLRYEF